MSIMSGINSMNAMNRREYARFVSKLSPDIEIIEESPGAPLVIHLPTSKSNNLRFLEEKFLGNWYALGGPDLVREYRFHPTRRWRMDFALVEQKIAFEIQGGLYKSESGHRSRSGVKRDYEKFNEAMKLLWRVFQVTSANLQDAAWLAQMVDYVRHKA